MSLQDIVRLVLPKEDHFYDFLEKQAALAHEGAVALHALADQPVASVRQAVHAIEKRGDKVAHEVEDALALTFVTPIDREDIHKLSSMLDDILDRAHATASAFDMYSIARPSEPALALMKLLVEMSDRLAKLMPSLRKHEWDTIREGRRELKRLEKQGDEIYRSAMKALFSPNSGGPTEGDPYGSTIEDARALIREKEVVELLEDAVDTCEDVAGYLTNLAVKHG